MQPEQQQRIMGYFIEEAKDHLNTIEQGLLNLQNTLDDSEMANEVFRAAHSVKGGAAMLGLGSIQRVSHRLEDFFKILKETPSVRTDQKLESLLLRVFDTLQELLEHLQGPFGLTEEAATTSMDGIEPVFAELEQHLSQLVSGAAVAPATPAALSWFQQQVPVGLRAMLELFKQADGLSDARGQLQSCCTQLKAPSAAVLEWNLLVDQVYRAIGIPENGYRTLAGVVLKDLKQAQELVLSGRSREVAASPALQALLPLAADAGIDSLFDLNSAGDELDLGLTGDAGEFDLAELDAGDLDLSLGGDLDDGGDLNLDGFSLDGESDDLGLGDLSLDGDDLDLSLGDFDLAISDGGDDPLDPNMLNSFADTQEGDEDLWQDLSETPVVPITNPPTALDDDMGLGLFGSELEAESLGGLELEGSDRLELDEDSTASLENLGELFMGLDESDLTFVQEEDDFFGSEDEDGGMGELDLDLFDLPESTAVGPSSGAASGDLSGLDFDGMDLFDSDPLAMPTSVEVSRDVVAQDALGLDALELDGDEDSFSEVVIPRTDYAAGLGDDFGLGDLELDEDALSLGASSNEIDDLGLGGLDLDEMVLDESGDLGDLDLSDLDLDGDLGAIATTSNSSSDDSTFLHADLDGEMELGSLSDDGGDLSFEDLMGEGTTANLQVEDGLEADLAADDGMELDLMDLGDLDDDSIDLSEFDLDGGGITGSDGDGASAGLELGGDDEGLLLDMSDLDGFDLDGMSGDDLDLGMSGDDLDLGMSGDDLDLGGLDGAIADPSLDLSLGNDDLDGFLDDPLNEAAADDFDFNALMGGAAIAGGAVVAGNAFAQSRREEASIAEDELDGLLEQDDDLGFDGMEMNGDGFDGGEFDGLDSLLDEPSAEGSAFGDLDALLVDPPVASPSMSMGVSALSSSDDAEFGDLEKLLEDSEGAGSGGGGKGLTPAARRPARPSKGFAEQTMRVPVKHLDNLSNLVGELVVNRNSLEQDQERMRQSLDNLLYQVTQLSDVGQRMQDLYERSLLESSLLASRQNRGVLPMSLRPKAPVEVLSNDVEYDPLEMDRFTGFHTLSQEMIELIVRVRESASDIEFIVDETDQVTRMFRQVTTQLSEGLTRSRMVPFAQTADRLPRAVRDIAMKCGKQAELVIEGRETLIDKMILEQLYDPMTHLVNNAITHGIESPDIRSAGGKVAAGRITIRAFHQGNQTVISVSDDGAGIDVERVRSKAVEKGLLSSGEAQNMSRLDLYDLLFHPGFSTKDQADDFSGRGVGMDVVRTSLTDIRGVINTDSALGKGTTFTIRLPLTLSISKALCCISDRARIAFPMDGVEDMLDLPKDRVSHNAEGQVCIPWRDTTLPLRPLTELLSLNRHLSRGTVYGGSQEEDMISVVVLRSAGNYLALQVDQVLGEQEIVIKQLEGPVPKPVGIAGATVLGDGRIMPIADVLELLDLAMGRIRRDAGSMWDQSPDGPVELPPAQVQPMVLIVDDSITVRELLSMTFNKVGYRVEQARDGQEAWEKLRSGLPCDIVFCDIEMPRMDGLELLSRIQKDVNLKKMPIAMLTSRGADRHRQMAVSLGARGYFTKPYLEEALLDAAARMLKGEILISNA
jgi:chemotaxis protein histidine kinase CheA/CheY-like chemotaxis protein